MIVWILPCVLLFWGTGFWLGMLFLLVAWEIFLAPLALNWWQHLLVALMGLSIPLAVYVAGLFLDQQALGAVKMGVFRTLAWALAAVLILDPPAMTAYLGAAITAVQGGEAARAAVICSAILNAALLAAAIVGGVLLLLDLAVALPLAWFSRALGGRVDYQLSAVRPLLLLFLAALSFQTVVGFLVRELWPATVWGLGG